MKLDYLSWNNTLAAHFFRPEKCGTMVHLYANEDLIKELGKSHTATLIDLVEAVKEGPPWVDPTASLCQKAYQSMSAWRKYDLEFPPYIAYLVLFVVAASIDSRFGPLAYYKPLRSLLGEPTDTDVPFPGFSQMQDLWKDLEQWCNTDTGGTLGLFNINWAALSKWKHVGLPISQTIITDAELANLKTIYAEAALDPLGIPSDVELRAVLSRFGTGLLRPRTLRMLKLASGEDRVQVLLSLVRQDLRSWDGEIVSEDNQTRLAFGAIRVAFTLDRVSRKARFTFRCKSASEFPEEPLKLVLPDGSTACCEEEQDGWSTIFTHALTDSRIDAGSFDWTRSLTFEDKSHRWKAVFRGSAARLFSPATDFAGYVEISRIPYNNTFFLVVNETVLDEVTQWGKLECDHFSEIQLISGLPFSWKMYEVSGVRSDLLIRELLPQLSLSKSLDITFVGGIRASRGNQFFEFARPSFGIAGSPESVKATSFGRVWDLIPDHKGHYVLNGDAPIDQLIEVSAIRGEENASLNLTLVTVEERARELRPVWFDASGKRVILSYDARALIAGARILNVVPSDFAFGLDTQFGKKSGYLIGRKPGQIVRVPEQSLPVDWDPVWFVERDGPKAIYFCGKDWADSQPEPTAARSAGNLPLWKDVIWSQREYLNPPTYPTLLSLWQEYQTIAEHI